MANVTIENSAQSITVNAGETIDVFVAENPTTGFQWTAQAQGGVDVAASSFEAPSTPTPGAAGRRHFRLVAKRPGTATLQLRHGRSWETSAADERTLTITVK